MPPPSPAISSSAPASPAEATPLRRCPLPTKLHAMRQSGRSVSPFSYSFRLLIRGSSPGEPNWHQPTQSSPSKTSAACASPARTRSSFRRRWSSARVPRVLVEADAPATAEDAVVRLDERRERVPRRLVERLDAVRRAHPAGMRTSETSRPSEFARRTPWLSSSRRRSRSRASISVPIISRAFGRQRTC